jgi:hypothetical protein
MDSSAGKMNHSILDEAASVAHSLGGGCAVFCKLGKDQSTIRVTYKQAQFLVDTSPKRHGYDLQWILIITKFTKMPR